MASHNYDIGLDIMSSGGACNWTGDTIKMLLVDNTYVFDRLHVHVNQITGELTDPSYNRQALTSKTRALDNTLHMMKFGAANSVFASLNNSTPAGAVIFKDNGSDATSQLIGFAAFTPVVCTGFDFDVLTPTNGWVQFPGS